MTHYVVSFRKGSEHIMDEFANILKKLRKDNDMTQDTLAEKLGIKRSTVGMYETG
ncbi:MAG: helix-turn-helix transcriptional regulator, partial [Firmicutes bacterium]|nr:helix-turn-helix transcriptional regulator [Bacillota bacterium]